MDKPHEVPPQEAVADDDNYRESEDEDYVGADGMYYYILVLQSALSC